jgi:uncharacterized protein (TIGR02145 family)
MKKGKSILIYPLVIMGISLIFAASCSNKDDSVSSSTVKDADGNVYHEVTVGTQVWMVENLKTTTYNDGTAIPLVTDNTVWGALTTPAYCWYNNDAGTNKSTYGALYNWYAVNTGKLCPKGWHVPSDAEWTTLTTYLGGESVAGGKLKEAGTTHWASPNTGANNSSGFTALPGGSHYSNGLFYIMGTYGFWWCATENTSTDAWHRYMNSSSAIVTPKTALKNLGFSVRCIKDN